MNRRRISAESVLIIVQNLPLPFDRRVWQEATTLGRAGFSVAVVCPSSKTYPKLYECLQGIHIYRYPLLIEASDSALGYLLEFVYCWIATLILAVIAYVRDPFQVIHACNPPDTYFGVALLFRPLGVKFVFDHHDLCPELYLAKGHAPRGLIYAILLLLERLTFRTADMVIAVNESYREIARSRGRVPENKIVVVRSGPPVGWARFSQQDNHLKRGGKFLVAFLGQIGKQDGVDYLLRAIRIYRNQYGPDARFVIIGDGPNLRSMRRLATELGITDTVEFLGRIPDEQLFVYLSNADLCVDPDPYNSFNNSSTMNKILEYMSFGKPILAFDLVEHRRSAMDAAHYVEPNNVDKLSAGIRELLVDEGRRLRMAKCAKDRFRRALAWDLTEMTLVRAYQDLLNESHVSVAASCDAHTYRGNTAVVGGKVA